MDPEPGAPRAPLERLLSRLALERQESDRFVGDPGEGAGRLFGGLLLAQAFVAAAATVDARRLHGLHAHFLRRGQHGSAIEFEVERLRDGARFAVRRLVARQAGHPILAATASFTASEEGLAHGAELPLEVPAPETLPEWEEVRARALGRPGRRRPPDAIEVRVSGFESAGPRDGERAAWMRPRGKPPDDPLLETALLVYASDRTLLWTGVRPHRLAVAPGAAASLNHALWLHRPHRFEDWLLYASESPVAHGGRAWVSGRLLRPDGVRVASVVQEGYLRSDPS